MNRHDPKETFVVAQAQDLQVGQLGDTRWNCSSEGVVVQEPMQKRSVLQKMHG